ncbi:MAG: hypothetical protein EBT97_07780, partial [Actinobacteria bacterium]|nr:hypothetical protein [Actinomycetota bacterium]
MPPGVTASPQTPFLMGSLVLLPSSPGSIVTSSHHSTPVPEEMCVTRRSWVARQTVITWPGRSISTCWGDPGCLRGV